MSDVLLQKSSVITSGGVSTVYIAPKIMLYSVLARPWLCPVQDPAFEGECVPAEGEPNSHSRGLEKMRLIHYAIKEERTLSMTIVLKM